MISWFVRLVVFCLSSCDHATGLFDVNFVSIMPKSLPIGGALTWTGAPLDLAAELVRSRFAGTLNLSVTLLYREDDRKCEDADARAPLLLAEYYYKHAANQCVAVMAASKPLFERNIYILVYVYCIISQLDSINNWKNATWTKKWIKNL